MLLPLLAVLALSQAGGKPQKASPPPPPDPYAQLTMKAPESRFVSATPLPGAGSIILDSVMDGDSIASSIAKNRGIQERMIWIDGTANMDQVNSVDKITALVRKIKDTGFNTVVFDVKPICGETLYPSLYAPQLTQWREQTMPAGFDPLRIMSAQCKAVGLSLIVSLNAFSNGHNRPPADVNGGNPVGPGLQLPDEQSVLYEPRITLKSPIGPTFPCSSQVNVMPTDASQIGVFNDESKLPKLPLDGAFAVTLARGNRVVDGFEGGGLGDGMPTIPDGGAYLIGTGAAGNFLRQYAVPGQKLKYFVAPVLVPTGLRPKRQIPLMMNPNDPRVQNHILDIVKEIARSYPVDGIMFDDRLRYAGLDADFSDETRQQFEQFVGHSVQWPESVYRYTMTTDFSLGYSPGAQWDAWLAFRALTIRNFMAKVRTTINQIRPGIQLGDYSGSWYGEYPQLGANWAAPGFNAGFWGLTPSFNKTGFARILDFLVTGCYYNMATVHTALANNVSPGYSVEAAGALTNRAVRDQCWSVAGISVANMQSNPEGIKSLMSAACATTQGVMVFDLSYLDDDMWAAIKQAFLIPKKSFADDPSALTLVRQQKMASYAEGVREPPVMILPGSGGIGQ